jgi:anti-anti-sigma factor
MCTEHEQRGINPADAGPSTREDASSAARSSPESGRVALYLTDDHAVVVVSGELDLAASGLIDRSLLAVRMGGFCHCVLDLAGVSFIDCAGLRTVADAASRARDCGGEVEIVGIHGQVERLVSLIGLSRQLAARPDPVIYPALTRRHALADRAAAIAA